MSMFSYIYSLAPGTNSIEVLALQGAGSANRVGAFEYTSVIQSSGLKFSKSCLLVCQGKCIDIRSSYEQCPRNGNLLEALNSGQLERYRL